MDNLIFAFQDPESKVNQLWKVDDATHIKFKKAKGTF